MARFTTVRSDVRKQKSLITRFMGVNTQPSASEGEFSDMMNMSNAEFPNLCVRSGRNLRDDSSEGVHSIGAKDKLYYVKNNNFHYDDEARFLVGDSKKQYAHIGSLIIIFPDKMYYDVEKNENGSLAAEYTAEGSVTFGTDSMTFSDVTADSGFYDFSVGDAIVISGCEDFEENNITAVISKINGKKITFTTDNIFKEGQENGEVTINREVPDMDYICEFGNRLWGCKGNEIYCSAYADPFNFNKFDGTKASSYNIRLGTDGDFTGMVSFMSHLILFKESAIHKLYGDNPNNYEIVTTTCCGVSKGEAATIKILNETVYYKGSGGVYAYTGGMPSLISMPLGGGFEGVCAGCDINAYYIRGDTKNSDGEVVSRLYVYYPRYGTWCIEDNDEMIDGFVSIGGELYASGSGGIYKIGGKCGKDTRWSFDMEFCETVLEKKGYGKLILRYVMDNCGGYAKIKIQYDDEPPREVGLLQSTGKHTVVPIPIRRSDKMRVHFEGMGGFVLEAVEREFYIGSEV